MQSSWPQKGELLPKLLQLILADHTPVTCKKRNIGIPSTAFSLPESAPFLGPIARSFPADKNKPGKDNHRALRPQGQFHSIGAFSHELCRGQSLCAVLAPFAQLGESARYEAPIHASTASCAKLVSFTAAASTF
jgi:hypothetical protein